MREGKKIRILHVAQAAGGVERYIQMLFSYLDPNKYENILVCSGTYNIEMFRKMNITCVCVPMQREIGIKNDMSAVFSIRKVIKEYKPDIVYAHSSKAGAICRLANFGIKNQCIYNPHGWAFNMRCGKKKKMLYTVIEKAMALLSDKIVCISEAERISALNNRICKDEKLTVINNGIDIKGYIEQERIESVSRAQLGIPEDAYVIGTVARLSEQKSPDIFIQAAKIIKKKIPNAYFLMVGDGDEREQIENYAEDNGFSDSLKVTGWVGNPYSYATLFDVALLLSRWEGFGLVLPEYMLAGCPIIATNVDAIPNIISDHQNGLLINPDNINDVVDAVVTVFSDHNLEKKLVSQGKEDVYQKYDVRRVAEEHETLFSSLVDYDAINSQSIA